jgi:hypothetical protein
MSNQNCFFCRSHNGSNLLVFLLTFYLELEPIRYLSPNTLDYILTLISRESGTFLHVSPFPNELEDRCSTGSMRGRVGWVLRFEGQRARKHRLARMIDVAGRRWTFL